MKKLYEVPTVFLLRIPAHLLSGSGSTVTEGGGSLTGGNGDGEASPGDGRAKENNDAWSTWDK